jgi:hypothetical protein
MAGVTPPTLEPWNESPIVRTMIQAKADLAGVKGFRVLLVITDGMDNRFAKDKKYNPDGLAIPEALRRQFEDSGIMVSVVGFKVVPAELAEARKQFAVLERLPVRGRFVEAEDVKPLIEVIDAAIGQRMRYWLERRNNVRIPPSGYQDVSAGSESLSWFLPGLEEGGFRVRVPGDPFISKDVFLSPGDRLLVRLEEAGGRPAFRRGKYVTADRFPLRTPVTRSGWQSAILQNQRQENGLRMLTTLERVPDPAETVLQMVRPRSVWLSVRPPVGIAKKAAVHWYYQPGYPAPAWGVDSPRWPDAGVGTGLTPPVLDLWWNPDRDFTPVQALDRESDFNDNSQLTGQSVVLDEGTDDAETAVIESVTAETHLVEVRPGEFKEEPCLVVRLRHQKPGRPAWVFQRGLPATAAEHRYFAEALASTHLFWPVKPEEAESLRRLLLVGVAGYKRQAEARGFALTRDDLPAPDPDDARPPLPVLLP